MLLGETWKIHQTETQVDHRVYCGLCSLWVPMSFPFVPFHWHSQMSLSGSQKINSLLLCFGFASLAYMTSACCPWVAGKLGALLGDPLPLAASSGCSWKEKRARKRVIYFMDLAPLWPNEILFSLSRVWTDWFILGQLSFLEPSFTQNNFF